MPSRLCYLIFSVILYIRRVAAKVAGRILNSFAGAQHLMGLHGRLYDKGLPVAQPQPASASSIRRAFSRAHNGAEAADAAS